ncbi:MAG: hypothetical protein GXO36_04945 [Chloroflexi bacterium]|nr:hypothetical protein [Chloroflexota bacterium]
MTRQLGRLMTLFHRGRIPLDAYEALRGYPRLFLIHLNTEATLFLPVYGPWPDGAQRDEEPYQAWCLHVEPHEQDLAQRELLNLAWKHNLQVYVVNNHVFAPRLQARRFESVLRQAGWRIRETLDEHGNCSAV